MQEVWKAVNSFPNYVVSNKGRVKNVSRNHVLKPSTSQTGYKSVSLYADGVGHRFLVHRLVAQAFIPLSLTRKHVNHIDADRTNNFVTNLEWVTPKENIAHAKGLGAWFGIQGTRVLVHQTGKIYASIGLCAKDIGGFQSAISLCLSGQRKSHMGYTFEEVNT